MRIVSKTRDYYDTAGGIDRTFTWARETKEVDVTELPEWLPQPRDISNSHEVDLSVSIKSGYVFFCGELHLFEHEERTRRVQTGRLYDCKISDHFFYDDVVMQRMKDRCDDARHGSGFLRRRGLLDALRDMRGAVGRKFLDWHLLHAAPVLSLTGWNWRCPGKGWKLTINPTLSEVQFASVIDPYQARQRIEQFLRNELAKEVVHPNPSDKERMLKHGMDKWSFRNPEPPKRKRK